MTQNKKSKGQVHGATYQRGMSVWTVLFVGGLLVIVGGAALKAAPSVIEFQAIKSAVETASKKESIPDIRNSFQRASDINDITSIQPSDLIIESVDGKNQVRFEYEKRVPLVGPVSLLIDYRGGAEPPEKSE